jgi:NADH-quinone oxidoreductase subunit D
VCGSTGERCEDQRVGNLERRTVAVGAAALESADLVLELGQQHPSTHGLLRLALVLDGDVVVSAEPLVGYLHRGAEKLFEVRDYRQVLLLANRHDWLSAFSNELGIALAVERMLGMQVPPRAIWLRTLLAELNRALSALLFLPGDLHAARELVRGVLEEASGGRMHYMFNRVGGLKQDVPAGWTSRCRTAVGRVRQRLSTYDLGPVGAGLGVLRRETVLGYGVSGPVARATGVDMDLRRDEPYLAYGELDVPVLLGTAGDAAARFTCLLGQLTASLDLVEACLDRLPPGEIGVRLPKTVRAPEGATYAWTENPLGLQGYYLVSRGERTPWRLAMRTASFNNVSALPALLPGVRLPDLPVVLASMFFVIGDIDK